MRALIVAVGVLIAATVGWLGSEQHYKNCVNAAVARTPIVTEERASGFGPTIDTGEVPVEKVVRGRAQRRAAVEGCSRLPF